MSPSNLNILLAENKDKEGRAELDLKDGFEIIDDIAKEQKSKID